MARKPLCVRNDLQHARESRLPGGKPLLEGLPLFATERTGSGSGDKEALGVLGELSPDETSTDD